MKKSLFMLSAAMVLLSSCGRNNETYSPQSFKDLEGHTICVLDGSIQQDYANAHLKDKNIKFDYYSSATDCMMALNEGKADAFFGASLYAFNDAFKRQNLDVCHETPECGGPIAFGIKKGNLKLEDDLNAFEDSLKKSGALDEIVKRWFNTKNTDFHDCVRIPPTNGIPSKGSKVLDVGICGIKQPAEVLINNKWTGCEIELLQMYAKSRGMELKIDTYDFGNLIPALETGKIDIIASTLAINPERAKKIDFATPYHTILAAFIIPGHSKEDVSAWDQLKQGAYYSLIAEDRWQLIVSGFWTTLLVSVVSLLLGSLLGGFICWLRMSTRKALRLTGSIYITLIRNTPMLILLMMMFYVILADTGLSPVAVAIVAFGINSSAYISEIYRTGIESVDRGQREAGLALGFSPIQTFFYIVAPQAAHRALPVFKNEAVALVKATSIVGYISIVDLTKASDLIRSASFEAFVPLIVVTVVYFFLAWLFTVAIDLLMKRI